MGLGVHPRVQEGLQQVLSTADDPHLEELEEVPQVEAQREEPVEEALDLTVPTPQEAHPEDPEG